MPAIHPPTPPAYPRKAGLAPRGTQQRPGSPGPGRTASLKQAALAPPPLQGLRRYYAALRLLTGHRPRLMDSPSGYPPGLFGGRTHMNTPSSGHGQTSLGSSTALSDHADPKHPRPAACGFAPYPSPAGDVPVGRWARLRGPYGPSPRPEATTSSRELRPGRLPRRTSDSASRRTPCALLVRAERVPRTGDSHPISSIEYQVLVGAAPWVPPARCQRSAGGQTSCPPYIPNSGPDWEERLARRRWRLPGAARP